MACDGAGGSDGSRAGGRLIAFAVALCNPPESIFGPEEFAVVSYSPASEVLPPGHELREKLTASSLDACVLAGTAMVPADFDPPLSLYHFREAGAIRNDDEEGEHGRAV